jgi:predicted lipoprotein with Yx(FWY)xxD motif
VLARRTPNAAGTVKSMLLGKTMRHGGTEQVTYGGHPLYYFVGDTHSGTTAGQGVTEFGAKWWLIAPSGSPISGSTSSSSSSSSSSGGGGWG